MPRPGPSLLILWIAGLASCRFSGAQPADTYLQVTGGADRGGVAVAWRRFDPPVGRPSVTLACMLHVGEPRFFVGVQERLERAAVVLMEGVIRERGPKRESPSPSLALGGPGRSLAEAFELVYQVDALVARPHFVAADIDAETFREEFHRGQPGGVSVAGMRKDLAYAMHRFRTAHPELDPEAANRRVRRGSGRRILAAGLQRIAAVPPRPVALHRQREAIALRALDQLPAAGEVILCWGFRHGPALARGLQARGYVPADREWLEVFAYGPATSAPAATQK